MLNYFKNRKLVKRLAELENKCDRIIDQLNEGKQVLYKRKLNN